MRSLRNKFASLLSFGVAVALASNATAAPAEYFTGHGDIGLEYDAGGNSLELHYHFEDGFNETGMPFGPEMEFEPDEVYVRVSDATSAVLPFDAPVLGSLTGDTVWILPLSEALADAAGLAPHLGIAAEELSPLTFSSIDLTLTGFSGPAGGEFALYTGTLDAPTVSMQTSDGLSALGDTYNPIVGDHDHENWGFSAPGVYDLTFTATAFFTAGAGGGSISDEQTFTFAVGDATAIPEPSSLLALASLGAFGAAHRRRRK
ncbi:MAG: choice-of-anchor M domain-containing protein [Planctomycetota bacterium]